MELAHCLAWCSLLLVHPPPPSHFRTPILGEDRDMIAKTLAAPTTMKTGSQGNLERVPVPANKDNEAQDSIQPTQQPKLASQSVVRILILVLILLSFSI